VPEHGHRPATQAFEQTPEIRRMGGKIHAGVFA
jgi:hypothetical protein